MARVYNLWTLKQEAIDEGVGRQVVGIRIQAQGIQHSLAGNPDKHSH